MSTSYISTRYVHSDQILRPWTYYCTWISTQNGGGGRLILSTHITQHVYINPNCDQCAAVSCQSHISDALQRGYMQIKMQVCNPSESFKGILLRGTYAFRLWATQHGSTKLRLDANQTRSWWGEPLVSAQKVWVSIRSSSIGLRITVCIVGLILTCSGVIGTGMMLQS